MAEAMPSAALDAATLRKPDTRLFGADTIVIDGVEHSRRDFEKVTASKPHQDRVHEARHALRQEFASRQAAGGDGAFVADDLNVYYDERDQQRAVVAPDIMVAVGVRDRPRNRNRYRTWEEGRPPDFVLEVLSGSTRDNDLGPKKAAYARMGVREYFILDGEGGLMDPPRLQGFRLRPGAFRGYGPIPRWGAAACTSRRAQLGYWSETLGLGVALLPGDPGARFYDPKTGDYLATGDEDYRGRAQEHALRLQSDARADEQQARADEQQARADEQQARAEKQQVRAEQQQARAEQEHAQRLQEQARAELAEARVAELERRLRGD